MAALNPNDAVIVATARSPIGRAFKGSLGSLRPDDLATTIVRTALGKVPELDPHDIADLYLGCGLPGGEQGFNLARVVDRKSTRLNSSHMSISYAVFCLKKKKNETQTYNLDV